MVFWGERQVLRRPVLALLLWLFFQSKSGLSFALSWLVLCVHAFKKCFVHVQKCHVSAYCCDMFACSWSWQGKEFQKTIYLSYS